MCVSAHVPLHGSAREPTLHHAAVRCWGGRGAVCPVDSGLPGVAPASWIFKDYTEQGSNLPKSASWKPRTHMAIGPEVVLGDPGIAGCRNGPGSLPLSEDKMQSMNKEFNGLD